MQTRLIVALLFIPAQILAIIIGAGVGASHGSFIVLAEARDHWREAGRKS